MSSFIHQGVTGVLRLVGSREGVGERAMSERRTFICCTRHMAARTKTHQERHHSQAGRPPPVDSDGGRVQGWAEQKGEADCCRQITLENRPFEIPPTSQFLKDPRGGSSWLARSRGVSSTS